MGSDVPLSVVTGDMLCQMSGTCSECLCGQELILLRESVIIAYILFSLSLLVWLILIFKFGIDWKSFKKGAEE